jgi:hypothetical protein
MPVPRTLKPEETRKCHLLTMMPVHKPRGEQLRLDSDRRNFAMTIHRRSALKGLAATGVGTAIFGAPAVLRGEVDPIRVGFLTVKTGPLASGGIQMEEGLTLYLKERNSTLSGRPVQACQSALLHRAACRL